jgi:hypothetical protein
LNGGAAHGAIARARPTVVDIELAPERQLAVIADAESRQASAEGLNCVAIPPIETLPMLIVSFGTKYYV